MWRARRAFAISITVGELVPAKDNSAHRFGELALFEERIVVPDGAVELEDPTSEGERSSSRPPPGWRCTKRVRSELGDEGPAHLGRS